MIIAGFIVLVVICALLAGLVAGGAVIAGILLLVGLIVLIVKAASSKEKNVVNVTVENQNSGANKTFPEIKNDGDVLVTEESKEENDNRTYIVKYNPAPDRETPEEIKISLERAYIALSGAQYDEANIHFDRILDKEPHFAPAYIGKLLCELKIRDEKNLVYVGVNFSKSANWDAACRFATEAELDRYQGYLRENKQIIEKWMNETHEEIKSDKDSSYDKLIARYDYAISTLDDFTDPDLVKLNEEIKKSKEECINKKNRTTMILVLILCAFIVAAIIAISMLR